MKLEYTSKEKVRNNKTILFYLICMLILYILIIPTNTQISNVDKINALLLILFLAIPYTMFELLWVRGVDEEKSLMDNIVS